MTCCLRISSLPIRFLPFHLKFRSYCKSTDLRGEIMEHVVFDGAQVMVGDPQKLHTKLSSIRGDGPSKLQVIADFDATLTKYWVDGQRGHSSHALLQQENPEYDLKRQKLYEYYHPLEIDPTIPLDEKAKLMEEWWEKTHGLLVEGGLNFRAIKSSVAKSKIAFRDGVIELFDLLERSNVLVLMFSAGLADIIEEVLRQKLHRPFKNVKIVSNRMVFDQNGNLVSFKGSAIAVTKERRCCSSSVPTTVPSSLCRRGFEPRRILRAKGAAMLVETLLQKQRFVGPTLDFETKWKTIYVVLNKNEHAIDMAGPVHEQLGCSEDSTPDASSVKLRTNVLLLGDHIGDLGMSDGLNYNTRISVGFLNDNIESSNDSYRNAFDVVYLNDASMWGVVKLASQLCATVNEEMVTSNPLSPK